MNFCLFAFNSIIYKDEKNAGVSDSCQYYHRSGNRHLAGIWRKTEITLKPVGTHLHFSIIKSDLSGQFLNETRIEHTLDPSPYLGVDLNTELVKDQVPQRSGDMLYLP